MDPLEPGNRRNFLKLSALAGLGLGLGGIPSAEAKPDPSQLKHRAAADFGASRPRPNGNKPVWDLTTKPQEKIRVGVIGLNRGRAHVSSAAATPFAEVVAVCDILDDRAKEQAEVVRKKTGKTPAIYSGDENAWEKMVARDDIDVVYIATPWEWHKPMAIRSMELGKHAFVEVNCGLTVDECWDIVDASEKYQRHCPILENCCYGEEELFVLNLARQGFFGDLKHGECGYIHDQRVTGSSPKGYTFLDAQREWRRNYATLLQGNVYPTHGLGTISQYMGIGRGDAFKYAVSVSSPEFGLSQLRERLKPDRDHSKDQKFVCGDMNTSIIKTELGRTIVVQHDNTSPRPYTRGNLLSGSLATFAGYPNRLAIDADNTSPLLDPKEKRHSHAWTYEGDKLKKFMSANMHPLLKKLMIEAKKVGGHGGMDHVMNYRFLDCLRQGITPDLTVYDAASWSALLDLSDRSVRDGSIPVAYPDFTRGGWKTLKPLPIIS
jgi:predicted dehydrogenase